MTRPVLKVFLKDGAKLPAYAHAGDSGLDLCSTQDVYLRPFKPTKVATGVHVEIPAGYEAQVRPRSGLSSKGVVAAFGTVDAGYVGEISVVVTLIAPMSGNVWDGVVSFNAVDYTIKAGDRIAQLVIAPVACVAVEQVATHAELGETERGERGFGSTGK